MRSLIPLRIDLPRRSVYTTRCVRPRPLPPPRRSRQWLRAQAQPHPQPAPRHRPSPVFSPNASGPLTARPHPAQTLHQPRAELARLQPPRAGGSPGSAPSLSSNASAFIGIVSSNLDEFFEVRVAGIKQQIEHESDDAGPDGMSPLETFHAIRKDRSSRSDRRSIPALAHRPPPCAGPSRASILHDLRPSLNAARDQAWASDYFRKEVFPVLDAAGGRRESSRSRSCTTRATISFSACCRPEHDSAEILHAVVQIPRVLPRLVRIPHPNSRTSGTTSSSRISSREPRPRSFPRAQG